MSTNLQRGAREAEKAQQTVTTDCPSKEDMKQGNREKMRKWSHTLSTCSKMSHPHWPRTDHGSCCHRLSASGASPRCGFDKKPAFWLQEVSVAFSVFVSLCFHVKSRSPATGKDPL